MNTQDLIQLGSVAVALVAVIVGPWVALRTSRHQAEAAQATANLQARVTVLSANRQAWINELRAEIAGFVSIAVLIDVDWLKHQTKDEIATFTKQLSLHLAKITLLINPNEADHALLARHMTDFAASALSKEHPTRVTLAEIIELAQKILKREWERVKRFE